MDRLLLIQPGLTEYDRQGRIQGTLDIPLCEDGRQQVEALAAEVREAGPAALYFSPCQSAEQTAELLGEAVDLKPKRVDKLQNLDYGLWQGMLIEDFKAKQPKVFRQWQEQPETVCPPQGETVAAARQRVEGALTKLFKRHKNDEVVAIVAPQPVAGLIRHLIAEQDLGGFWGALGGCDGVEVLPIAAAPAGVS